MTNEPKDDFYSWLFLLFGGLLFVQGCLALYGYFSTGQVFFRNLVSMPFNLEGPEAAAMHAALLVVGAIFIASGIKGLLRA